MKLFTSCVSKFYACHVKRRWMSQSATPATQSAATCRQVPRLPRKKPRRPRRHVGTQRATRASPVPYVPRLPRKVTIHVAKCHACVSCMCAKCHTCHAKCSYMSPRTNCVMKLFTSCVSKYHACHVIRRWMSQSATPATQSAATCRQVPRLPRKKPRRPRRHVGTQRATRASPVPYVPRLPRKVTIHVAKNKLCDEKLFTSCVSKYHACHVKRRWMSQSATPATQSAATCRQVPRLRE